MNNIKNLFNEHWEKLFLGLVAIFCLYSLSISLFGILGKGNDQENIRDIVNETTSYLQKGKGPVLDVHEKAVAEFQKSYEAREGFAAYSKLLPAKLFSEETKDDPLKNVQDIAKGHTSSNSSPGVSCEKFFCKIKGENQCLVCGAKGDREYTYNPPRLTDIKTLRSNMVTALESNPYLDRQKIRIIWEDDIETDRTTFKSRKGNVYRIEITEKNEKELMEMVNKPSYQKEMRDFIANKNNKIVAHMKDGKIVDFPCENVGGVLYKKPETTPAPRAVTPENKLPDIFNTPEEKPAAPANNATPPVEEVKVHKLHDEKVFFNFEDTNFEPLKKYRYVLLETFSGESVTRKALNEWRFSKPVDITTGAENIFYLSKITPELGPDQVKVMKDGKEVLNAEFKIYQYIRVQNLFYKKDFAKLRTGEDLGSFMRLSGDKIDNTITTSIKKSKTEFLKGTDLTDAEWALWKEKYPTSMKARRDKVEIELSYFTGYRIVEIGEEEVMVRVKVGPKKPTNPPTYDEKGNPILEQETKEEKQIKPFALIENTLTKVQRKVYRMDTKEIAEDLKKNNVKTVDDISEDK